MTTSNNLSLLFLLFTSGHLRVFGQTTTCDEPLKCEDASITTGEAFCSGRKSCKGATITGDYARCHGYYSCTGAKIDVTDTAWCYGSNSCRAAVEIRSKNEVKCNGYYGCYKAGPIMAESNVYCDSINSCREVADITAGNNMYCDGDVSCRGGTIDVGNKLYCNGNLGCYEAIIEVGIDVHCDGDNGCAYSTINAGNDIICYGKKACQKSTLTANDYVIAHGYYAAYDSIISAERVDVYGYRGVSYSTLDSTDELAMNVNCYGYEGGLHADFICRSASTCNLDCKNDCCAEMEFICLSGATCSYSCDGADCPIYKTSLSGLPIPAVDGFKDDDGIDDNTKILRYLKNKQKALQNDKVYIEIEGEIAEEMERWNELFKDIADDYNKHGPDFDDPDYNAPDLIVIDRRIMMNYIYSGMSAAFASIMVVLIAYCCFIKSSRKSAIYSKVIVDDVVYDDE